MLGYRIRAVYVCVRYIITVHHIYDKHLEIAPNPTPNCSFLHYFPFPVFRYTGWVGGWGWWEGGGGTYVLTDETKRSWCVSLDHLGNLKFTYFINHVRFSGGTVIFKC